MRSRGYNASSYNVLIAVRRDPRKLQAALAERLPGWMVPQRIVFLDALPLTANGKIDYQALKQRHTPEAENRAEADLPRGDIEKQVATLWQQLLSTGPVTRETDFFQQGGDSLLATRLTGQLRQAGYEAQLSDLFNQPRLADFAATLRKIDVPVEQQFVHSPEERYQPFALTDVQQAYPVGVSRALPRAASALTSLLNLKLPNWTSPGWRWSGTD